YGEDLAEYLSSPYQGHPLCEAATWSDAAGELAVEVSALALRDQGVTARQVVAACDHRMARRQFDAVLFDGLPVADELGDGTHAVGAYIVEGVAITSLPVSPEGKAVAAAHIRDSVVEILDLVQAENAVDLPTLERCVVGCVEGVAELPVSFESR